MGATRARVMYNFRYELDLSVEEKHGRRSLQRVAVCSQEWHGPGAPDYLRYHLLWRAAARRNAAAAANSSSSSSSSSSARPGGFRVQKDFRYRGHFPCALDPEPLLHARANSARGARSPPRRGGFQRRRGPQLEA